MCHGNHYPHRFLLQMSMPCVGFSSTKTNRCSCRRRQMCSCQTSCRWSASVSLQDQSLNVVDIFYWFDVVFLWVFYSCSSKETCSSICTQCTKEGQWKSKRYKKVWILVGRLWITVKLSLKHEEALFRLPWTGVYEELTVVEGWWWKKESWSSVAFTSAISAEKAGVGKIGAAAFTYDKRNGMFD